MAPTRSDEPYIALIYFTEEEAKILQSYFAVVPTEFSFSHKDRTFELMRATRNCPPYGPPLYLVHGLRAPSEAKDFCYALLAYKKPILVVNIGTAGRLADWMPIGTIVNPNAVTPWDDDSRLSDGPKGIFIEPDGTKAISLLIPRETSPNFRRNNPDAYRIWMRECKRLSEELAQDLGKAGMTVEVPLPIANNALASGSMVITSEVMKEQIQSVGRKYCAVDMESYAVASTFQTADIPVFILRCLTDPAVKLGKDALDSYESKYQGETYPTVRLFSLVSAAALLKHVLHRLPAVTRESEEKSRLQEESHLVDHLSFGREVVLAESLPKALEAYGRYFSLLMGQYSPETVFDEYLSRILKGSGDLRISGTPGSGKSSFLGCLFLRHRASWQEDSSLLKPSYIDIQRYISPGFEFNIGGDLDLLALGFSGKEGGVIYIDGYDSYVRDPVIQEVHSELRHFLKAYPKVRRVYAVGKTNRRYGLDDPDTNFRLDAKELLVLEPCPVSDAHSGELIEAFCALPRGAAIAQKESILARMKIIDTQHVDLFILSMLASQTLLEAFESPSASLGTIYFEFFIAGIQKICEVEGATAEEYLRRLAQEIYNDQVRESKSFENDLDSDSFDADQLWFEKRSELRQFALQHPSLRQFLVAEYILDKCFELPDTLSYRIYNYGINRFLKTLANRNDRSKDRLFKGIIRVIEEAPDKPLIQAHLAYLLGRLNLTGSEKMIAREKLYSYLKRAREKYEVLFKAKESSGFGILDDELAWAMLLLRTLYISLVYQGDLGLAENYVAALLSYPEWDLLNRGFHMQYYGDIYAGIQKLNMVETDINLLIDPIEVRRVLCDDLIGYVDNGTFKPRALVELHTLLSLHVNRHIDGHLKESVRLDVLEIVTNFVDRFREKFPTWYLGYVDLVIEIMNMPAISGANVVANIMDLKNQLRSGWNFVGERNHREVTRNVTRTMRAVGPTGVESVFHCQPESVADHSWSCAMLAWMAFGQREDINLDRLIRILLVHDLPEIETGDQVWAPNKDATAYAAAKVGAVGYLQRFSGARDWTKIFEELDAKTTTESRIAHDIDKIERYVQAVLYTADPKNSISDLADWRPSGLLTKYGRDLLESLDGELKVMVDESLRRKAKQEVED